MLNDFICFIAYLFFFWRWVYYKANAERSLFYEDPPPTKFYGPNWWPLWPKDYWHWNNNLSFIVFAIAWGFLGYDLGSGFYFGLVKIILILINLEIYRRVYQRILRRWRMTLP